MATLRKPGRPQNQDKRAAILIAGKALIATQGFDFSMEDAASKAGVARQTVYNVYPNKQALIAAVFEEALDSLTQYIDTSGAEQDIEQALIQLAQAALDILATPERVGLLRAMISPHAIDKGFGPTYYSMGPEMLYKRLANYLAQADTGERWVFSNPALAADMFLSLVMGSRQLRALLSVEEPAALGQNSDRVRLTVEMFLRAHQKLSI